MEDFALFLMMFCAIQSIIRARKRQRLYEWFVLVAAMNNVSAAAHYISKSTLPKLPRRSPEEYVRARSRHFFATIVMNPLKMKEEYYVARFRMHRATVHDIIERLRPHLAKENTKFKLSISVEHQVHIALWRLAHGEGFGPLGDRFGVGQSTASKITDNFCKALMAEYQDEVIKFPQGDDLKKAVYKMARRAGLPHAAFAVDGSHIAITKPHKCPDDYFNRKGFYSMVLQGVVDADGAFVDVFFGTPGSVHDAKIWRESQVAKRIREELGESDWKITIDDVCIHPYVLGDSAYPGSHFLLKPYPQSSVNDIDTRRFNLRHCRTRQIVEQAFGMLKCRWRILLGVQYASKMRNVARVVFACCILHNICIRNREVFNTLLEEGNARIYADRFGSLVNNGTPQTERCERPTKEGEKVRNTLKRFLKERSEALGFYEPRLAE